MVCTLGIAVLLAGILEVLSVLDDRNILDGVSWMLAGGVMTVLIGVILLAAPLFFGHLAVRLLAVCAFVAGVVTIVNAFQICSLGVRGD